MRNLEIIGAGGSVGISCRAGRAKSGFRVGLSSLSPSTAVKGGGGGRKQGRW